MTVEPNCSLVVISNANETGSDVWKGAERGRKKMGGRGGGGSVQLLFTYVSACIIYCNDNDLHRSLGTRTRCTGTQNKRKTMLRIEQPACSLGAVPVSA